MRYSLRNQGFSLTELLIVSVIIAVVIAGLISLAGTVRNATDLARCTHHLRTLHLGLSRYLTEHHQNFTSSRWDLASTHSHTPGFRDYLDLVGTERSATVLTCPAIQRGLLPSGRWMEMNYAINTRATRGYHTSSLETARGVTRPSKLMLFTEGAMNPGKSADVITGFNYFVAVSWTQKQQLQWIHRGAQNAIFMDGHVELIYPKDFPEGVPNFRQPFWSGADPL